MNPDLDAAASSLKGKLAGASTVTNFVFATAERLSTATVSTVMSVLGGSTGLLTAFAIGVASPHFDSSSFLAGATLLGGSAGALLSRLVGPGAHRLANERDKSRREIRQAEVDFLIETWNQLPKDRPERLIDALAFQIEQTVASNDLIQTPRNLLPPPYVPEKA